MKFPHPNEADAHGLVYVGGRLTVENLVEAYSQGIFPWPQPDLPLLWFSPQQRGILRFKSFRVSRSAQRLVKKNPFQITMNHDFSQVIENCSRIPRQHEKTTWIIPEVVQAYKKMHQKGYAISVEAWEGATLVGGLYGVLVKGVFSGESMFFKKSGASKMCLIHLVEELKKQNHEWIDIQMVTPVLKLFGGEYISRQRFLDMLKMRHSLDKGNS